jgi:predicted NUDIX family NTP pyrophosphohydrolase
MFRGRGRGIRLLLVHPGGPFWAKKDDGAWSIPKGEYDEGEDPLAVARREFEEELGSPAPAGGVIELGELVQPSRKQITAYAIEGDFDPSSLKSNLFAMEWPPRSGTMQSFPEVDRAEWFRRGGRENPARSAPFIDAWFSAWASGLRRKAPSPGAGAALT